MKKGFTLVELIAVIAILGLLSLIVIPNAISMYNSGVIRTMETQEKNILDASDLFILDNCKNRINTSASCPNSYLSTVNDKKYICLSDIQTSGYIETVKYRGDICKGLVIYTKNDNGKYTAGNTYLYCGTSGNYSYTTKNAPSVSTYSGKCGL